MPVEPFLPYPDDDPETLNRILSDVVLALRALSAGTVITIIDAKGDLIVGTADNVAARLAAGTNGQFLVVNSATTTGLQWTTHGSSGDPHSQYATDTDLSTHAAAADPHTGYQKESEKSSASGYASLDGSAKVPIAEIPTGTTSSTVSLGDHAHSGSASITQLHEHAIGEDLTAETDGVKVTFLTANEFEPETVAVYLLGARLRPGTDYTEDAGYQSITFGAAPSAADELILDYVAA